MREEGTNHTCSGGEGIICAMYEKYLRSVLKVGSVRDWKWSVRAVRGGGRGERRLDLDLEYGGFAIRLKEVRRYEEGFFDEKRVWVIGREREEGRGGEGKEGKEGVLIFFL